MLKLSQFCIVDHILQRKEQKKHGTCKMIEGEYEDGSELIIIDDVLTSGTSIIESLEHLKQFKIKKIVVVVDREEGGREILENMGYTVESIFKVSDFTAATLRERIYETIIKNKVIFVFPLTIFVLKIS